MGYIINKSGEIREAAVVNGRIQGFNPGKDSNYTKDKMRAEAIAAQLKGGKK